MNLMGSIGDRLKDRIAFWVFKGKLEQPHSVSVSFVIIGAKDGPKSLLSQTTSHH